MADQQNNNGTQQNNNGTQQNNNGTQQNSNGTNAQQTQQTQQTPSAQMVPINNSQYSANVNNNTLGTTNSKSPFKVIVGLAGKIGAGFVLAVGAVSSLEFHAIYNAGEQGINITKERVELAVEKLLLGKDMPQEDAARLNRPLYNPSL